MIALQGPASVGRAETLPGDDTHRAPTPWGRWGLRATAIAYLGLMIVLPLAAVAQHGLADGLSAFLDDVTQPLAIEALGLTIGAAVVMTAVNAVMGTLTAYALVRYRFPGRGLLDGIVDLPFAIPTLVTGVMLVALYGPQTDVGSWLAGHGVPLIYAKPGIVLALLFVCYPFVVRTVQPVIHGAEKSQEEAAFLTGSMLSFARALGEFGSIIIVAGNIPGSTLTAPVYLYQQVEGDNTGAASAISIVLLALSFSTMWAIDRLQRRGKATRARI
jgi:sulfate transport system permease protein